MLKQKIENILPFVEKPARYTGGELNSVIKDKDSVDIRVAFCFPDVYEVGMSHLGMKILYSLLNRREDTWCERVFAPWVDMEDKMRENNIPLYGLESMEPIRDFDFVAFTLQYEMSYSNILNMLSLTFDKVGLVFCGTSILCPLYCPPVRYNLFLLFVR